MRCPNIKLEVADGERGRLSGEQLGFICCALNGSGISWLNLRMLSRRDNRTLEYLESSNVCTLQIETTTRLRLSEKEPMLICFRSSIFRIQNSMPIQEFKKIKRLLYVSRDADGLKKMYW